MNKEEIIKERNKKIQKKRKIEYFIDAARQIIDNDSIQNITIRKVGELAGYNSATIYKYFDDLNHLKFFAAMTYLNDYIDEIPNYIKDANNSKEIYFKVWDCFIDKSFEIPNIYQALFLAELKKDLELYVKQFYNIFPLDIEKHPSYIQEMLRSNSLNKRSKVLMDKCVEDGLIERENAVIVDDIIISLYENYLGRVYKKQIPADEAKIIVKKYMREIFNRFS
ncbi:TetR/AcrR family transcriptional regulator [Miniphocaeibacter halophilus]|uniref:TetR/AcrR family transcriptional regulator n=1 Tax=Miniphocaeibacter halophilus TaxID=2931922 RepID=A0AC61MT65_9FIRM|nr:TetR/AcrR family transcriptional regulator [Miniphocaeibacter halophilus]QQK07606.1 TetR/AcrR family transcriptional regulator [Miniphocaeibacter halophilus]